MIQQQTPIASEGGEGSGSSYEPPELVPIGNLHDLLGSTTGSQCDAPTLVGTGTDTEICG